MKKDVTVIPDDRLIIVDGVGLVFDFDAPVHMHALQWHDIDRHIEWNNDLNHSLTEADYEDDVAPFVALWAAEKTRLEEEANRPPTPPTLDETRAAKLAELGRIFAAAEATGHLLSAVGFEIDATERANRDVSGLITVLTATGEASTVFCGYDNTMRPVTLENLHTMQLEIIAYGQQLYARKWTLRSAIDAAKTVADLEAIEISFDDLPAPETGVRV